jgi:CheY-like chemotaxis protein
MSDAATSPWRILVVDDHASVHAMFSMLLRRLSVNGRGFALTTADSAAHASALLDAADAFDIVLADLHMESAGVGIALLRAVAVHPRHRGARRVLHTGDADLVQDHADGVVTAVWEKTGLTPTTVRERLEALLRAA